ncbi:hypothetical protein K1719_018682 [Acacia pycnantha]|nr:hypothetical protein K1719_018682 [Acacia pycnantha]
MSIIKERREKRVFPVGELKHINQRLKILEEDMETMKKAILWHVKEKRRLVKRIYHYFQCMQYMLLHRSKATKGEQVCHQKLIMKTPKDGGALLTGLPEVLYHNSNLNPSLITHNSNLNPSLITKGFQATVNYSPHIYDSSI